MTNRQVIDDNGQLLVRALHFLESIDARLQAIELRYVELAAAYALLASPPDDAARQEPRPQQRRF